MKIINIKGLLFISFLFIAFGLFANVTKTVGNSDADYTTLKAAFDAINAGTLSGDVTLQIVNNTTETTSAILYQSGYTGSGGTSSYSSVNIYPTTTGLTIQGNLATPLIDLNGADNVTIDGRVNASGSTRDLIITNTSTSSTAGTSTIRFVNDASSNTVKYCNIKGSETVATSGIVFLSTAATTGNNNNTIDNNNITSSTDANRPLNAVFSIGTASFENNNITISNNSIYNVLSRSTASYGINLAANTIGSTVSNNSIYETATFIPTASVAYTGIYINNATGNNFTVTGNYIGGQSALCGGSAWTKTNAANSTFIAINLNGGTTTASNIQGNTIQNFAWSNSGSTTWTGITVTAGNVNVGTTSANTIGSNSGTGSISVTGAATGTIVYGINIASTGTVDCENNIISSITGNSTSALATNIYGIYKSAVAGTTIISNNTIGSTTTANSINANSTSTANVQSVYGIYNAGTGTVTISGNTIANLTNSTNNATAATAGLINGICSTNGANTIANNTIRDLTIANANNLATNSASVGGIVLTGSTLRTVSGNTIYNLSNTYSSFAGSVLGLYFSAGTGANVVSGNYIYNLSVNAASTAATLYGIDIASGATTYSNNIINLGGNTATTIYGIYDIGSSTNNTNLYFNTVYIGGTLSSGVTNKSYTLYSAAASNSRNYSNNIFSNARSTTSGSNLHYAAYFNYAINSNLTLDYNDYYAPGTGGVLGYYNAANVGAIPLVSNKDLLSVSIDPQFANAGGTNATDYFPAAATIRGTAISGITTDFSGTTRAATPTMGSFEGSLFYNIEVWTSGTLDGQYTSLKSTFDAINYGIHTGDIDIKIQDNTIETASAALYQSGYTGSGGVSSYSSINIYPVSSGLSVTGNLASPLIDLNGADNVSIDGRVDAIGTVKDLLISNTNTSATVGTSTIRFINDATYNDIQFCTIKGSETVATSGIIFFSTGLVTGNDYNTIDSCNITSSTDANRPLNVVYSAGTAGFENDNLTISNCNIYNFLNRSTASYGIDFAANTTTCTISGNSLYETATFVPTASVAYTGIYINNASGNNFTVSGNFIGGQSASCGGSAWTKTNAYNNIFTAINLNVGSVTSSNLQGNTIQNFNWSNSGAATWTAVNIGAGNVNIGTSVGNTVGVSTGTGSVTVTGGASGTIVYGVNIATAGTVDCENNIIGSITADNGSTLASNFYGINKAAVAGTTIISNNTIGSTTTSNSINASSASTANAQSVYGIYTAGTGTVTMNNNTVSNLNNNTSNTTIATTGLINGICSTNGTNTITNNTVRNLSIANANNSGTNSASIGGIILSTATLRTVTGNTIYNLSNNYSSFTGSVIGLYFSAGSGANVVSGNFIYNLSVNSGSTAASFFGIKIASGTTTYYNNIISLGGNTATTIYGVYDSGQNLQACNLYFNSVYISGSLASGITNPSYALYSLGSSNVRNYSNNIFDNSRSTTSGSYLHYAAFFNYGSSTNLTLDYNDYYAPGTGGVLGYYNTSNVNSLPLVSTKDLLSISTDPLFAKPGGLTAVDYFPSEGTLRGNAISGITTDYPGSTRAKTPTMGAFEGPLIYNIQVWISGSLQGQYTSLKSTFDAINLGTHTGNIDIKIQDNIIEIAPAVLYQSGYTGSGGISSYSAIKIYPILTGLSISGNLATPLIDLNGADNVTIDGRVNATGSTKSLSITNFSASAVAGTSTIRFIKDATLNTVKYCTIKGSETNSTSGVIFFSSASITGNDNNIIDNCNITNSADASRPLNIIYSSGTSGFENDNLTISNNNIYNFLHRLVASNGVSIGGYTTNCSIINNSFYETATFTPTGSVAYNAIIITNTSGNNFTVSGNFIGGQSALCGGSAWTKTNAFNNTFTAINLTAGTTTASSIQGNTIQNFLWSNSGSAIWTGINITSGNVNVGTTSTNTIGAITGTGSITVTGATTGTNVYGINITTTGTVDCEYNTIGSISANNSSTFATNIYVINKSALAGTTTISNNTIGSNTTANSIFASSASTSNAQTVYGIYSAGIGTVTINGNTIANLTNSTANITVGTAGLINGICSTNGVNSVSNNTIRDLTIANANNSATNTASVGGIVLTASTLRTVSGNTIYNLSNSYSSFTGCVIGLYFSAGTGSNVVSGNYIYNLSVNSTSTTAALFGIKIASGATTYSNNIVNIGGNTASTIYGIYDSGAGSQTCNLYFNSIYIGGSLSVGVTNKSYALFSASASNIRNFRNNIFNNSRSTTSGSNLHYVTFFNYATTSNLTVDYNDYYAPGNGGMLAYFNNINLNLLASIQTSIGQNLNSITTNPAFANAGGTNSTDYIPTYRRLVGTTGTGITTDYASTSRTVVPTIGAFDISLLLSVEVWKSGVFQAQYLTLKNAFDNINNGTHTGALDLKINSFTTETTSAILYQSGYTGSGGTSSYSSVNIYPTTTGLTIQGNLATPLIDLNGADNVTIDGRVNASGSTRDLIITNTSTSATAGTSTIRFVNDASSNTVKYCNIKGSETVATSGIVFFSTAATTGNNNNTIDNNNITSSTDANRPLNAVFSIGTASFENNNITISNNSIYNVLSRSTASYGINLAANTIGSTVSNNSIYETATFIPTASVAYTGIYINNATGNNFTVTGNYIGGQSALCGGSAWTKTNAANSTFIAINLNGGTTTASNIQGNTIQNFAWSNSGSTTWTGITVTAGNVNVGTTSANTIGSNSGTGSISVTGAATGTIVYGINIASTGTVDCENNIISSITGNSTSALATNIYGIYKSAVAGTTIISNNTIGSTTTANSINANSTSTANVQSVYGIYNAGTGTVTISGNTIANLTNSTNNATAATAGLINGICSTNGANTIANNTIRDLTIANANNLATNSASVGGIVLTGSTLRTVSGNTIYNLSNTYSSFAGSVLGLYFSAGTGANVVSGNYIYNLSVNAASTAATLYGIDIASGATTYSNNIINLGGNTATTIYGIYDIGSSTNNTNLYFNTVYIGGTLSSGVTNKSYTLYSAAASNSRNYSNNIFSNARSTTSGSNLHYAAYFNYAINSNLTLDYNDYYASGTGGVLGYYNAANVGAISIFQSVIGQNLGSISINPAFSSAGGTNATDYIPTYKRLVGGFGTGITTDFSTATRATFPTIGAFEVSLLLSVEVWKGGTLQARYATLKSAFDAINYGTHTGILELRLANFTTETASAVLYQSGYTGSGGTSSFTSINIYPTITGLSIAGNLASPLIDLNGADNVTIDGRVNATGSTKDLVINNTSTSGIAATSTIRFINDAGSNSVKYCNIKGSETVATSGIIFFSTSIATGNSNNTIDNNNITSSFDVNRPINAIFSTGTASFDNNNITISNNNIFDVFSRSTPSYGINLAANTISSSVSNNSLYETATFIPTVSVAYTGIYINNANGTNFTVSGNYIGGQAALCGGNAWSKTNAFNSTFTAINLNVGTGTASNIQGNTIQNFAWSNSSSATWTGINIAGGLVNIGTTIGNTIGANTGTGSISITSGATGNVVYGICLAGSGTTDSENNIIGSINTINASTDGSTLYAISRTGSGIATINNNLIGSNSTANSLNATSASTANSQAVCGIFNSTSSALTVNGNTIANLTNATTNSTLGGGGNVNGITVSSGACTVNNNIIHDLTIANANSSNTFFASVCAIAMSGAYAKTVSGNTIYNLSNTYASFVGSVIGISYVGNVGNNYISGNFISNLSVSSSSTGANLYGIKMDIGKTNCYNNIINLGGNTATTIYGIYDAGSVSQSCYINFNSVYISGNLGAGLTNKSYCLYSFASANTRDYRSNLFVNTRSTTSGSNLHYAAYFNYGVSTLLSLDFNDYYVTGTGGVLGFFNNTNVITLPLISGFDTYSLNINPLFATAGGNTAANYNVSSDKIAGYTISGITTDYAGTTRKGTPTMGAFEGTLNLNIDVYNSGVLQSSYYCLKDAFDKINNGTHTGALELRVKASTTETASAILYQSGYSGAGGTSSYSSVKIYPTISGLSISANLANHLIDFNGADNVTIDGRVNATGSTKDLVINNTNTGTSASTIHFINSAENNTVKYCTIKGSETTAASGIVYFSTASAANGNSSNTFDNDNFTGNTTNRPVKVFYSAGSAGFENKNNTISNCNFYDFLNPTLSSYGFDLASATMNWNISGNSFYETTTFTPTAANNYNIIRISTGDNNQATGNFIGGSSSQCGGSAWTIRSSVLHYFCGIYISGGSSAPCLAQNNTISNIDLISTQSNPFDAIYINSGNVNIYGNTIGATTGTGSIKITTPVPVATTTVNGGVITAVNVIGGGSGYTTPPVVTFSSIGGSGAVATANLTAGVVTSINVSTGGTGYVTPVSVVFDGQNNYYSTSHGIRNFSSGVVNIIGNNVGSITTTGTNSYSHGFEAIIFNGMTGTLTISNNLIGSLTTANSIFTSSSATASLQKEDLYGIYSFNTSTAIISGNTIANLTNGYAGILTSATKAISTTAGSNNINNNVVHDISAISIGAPVYGIHQSSAIGGTTQTIANNTIYNLNNTNSTDRVDIYGIYSSCPTSGTNTISGNFVRDFSLSTSNTGSNLYGIYPSAGLQTVSNNIVSLGSSLSTGYGIYGIYDASITTTNLYFNSVYVGGTVTGTTSFTAALWNSTNASTRNYQNNIFYNTRTGGATGKHYAVRLQGNTSLTINYNDYFVSSGGIFGSLTSDKNSLASWQSTTGQDANSLNLNPNFIAAGSAIASDYKPDVELNGVIGTGITTDFSTSSRINPPSMGAWEIILNKWKGSLSTDWNTGGNWTRGVVLSEGSNLYFDSAPVNHCLLNTNHSVNNIINTQATYRTVTNGYKLTVAGDFVFSNGAQINASTTNSTVEFSGSATQNIYSGMFYNNDVYNLAISNANNVTLFGTLNLLNNITITSGKLDAYTNSPTISYTGTSPQTIETGQFLTDKLYNLTVNNSAGVTINSNLTVNNVVTINSGKKLTIPATKQLNVVGTITNNAGVSGLQIQSSSSAANGTLIYHNTFSSPVSATVEMYSKASWNLSDTVGNRYKWQYFGIPLQILTPSTTLYGAYVRKWYESGTSTTNHWIQQQKDSTLTSFVGYEICQASPKTYYFAGQLENRDFNSGQLPFTTSALYPGQHIFANPYTAAISINQLTFGSQTESTAYLYNTGTLGQWINVGPASSGNSPGQYLSVPKFLAGIVGLPGQIPSMGALLIKAQSNSSLATFGITYSSVVTANTDQQRVMGSNDYASTDKICTIIDVKGENSSDRIWLLTQPECTRKFDNGWDGTKLSGNALSAQLFAIENDGLYQIDAFDDMNNTDLGFQAGQDRDYTLTFTHINTSTKYAGILLLDMLENKTIDITETGSTYSFTAESTTKPINRFKIITFNTTESETDNKKIKIFSASKTAYIENMSNQNGKWVLYDTSGHVISNENFTAKGITTLIVPRSGAYILKASTPNVEVTQKIIMF
ncbi:MAG: hypothetical protein WCK78_00680 [Paludibacter sp.]